MRILFLCAGPPRPDGASDSVIAYNRIRLLSQRGHRISLACFLRGGRDTYPAMLDNMVEEMELLPPMKTDSLHRVLGDARFLLGASPFAGQTSRDMQKLVGRLVERTHCDVLMAESVAMGPYLFENPFLPAVHRVVSRQGAMVPLHADSLSMGGYSPGNLREWLVRRAIAKYELRLYRFVDHVISLTFHERLHLLRRCPELNVSVIPYGVDIDSLPSASPGGSVTQVLLTGCYTEADDLDGARWFLREVWPSLASACPDLSLCICGNAAVRQLRSPLASENRVRLVDTSSVMPEEVERSQIFVSPIRSGAGFQGRVLRMLGAGMPVVATSHAVEGIPVQTGSQVLLADTPHTMQEMIRLLAGDPTLRVTLGKQARAMVGKHFSWQRCVDSLEHVLLSVVGE